MNKDMNKRKYIKRRRNKNKKMKIADFKKKQEIELNNFMKNENEIIVEDINEQYRECECEECKNIKCECEECVEGESVEGEDEIMVENEIIEEKKEEKREDDINGDNELMNKINRIKKKVEKLREIKLTEIKIENVEKGPSGNNEIPAEYKLTKNEYLMYLYENILSSGCNTESLIRFIIMALPGIPFDDRMKIIKDGPKLNGYSGAAELMQYSFGRLIQYKSHDIYKNRINKITFPDVETSRYSGNNFNYYHVEDIENHKVYLTKEPQEPEPNLM